MALIQRKFTDLPSASALGAADIIPIVSSPTNVNKKIAGQTLIDSLTISSLPPLTSYLIDNNLIVDASILNPDNFIRPIQNDAVERIRVSNPQSLIDTDFEYSLQSSKWESLQLINNIPSLYVRSNEPSFTNEQIKSITKFTETIVAVVTSTPTSDYADPRASRNGPLSAGWTVIYEGVLQDNYDNYGNFLEQTDNLLEGEFLAVNTGYNTVFFGTSYTSIVFGGWRPGVSFDQYYNWGGISTTPDQTVNRGIYVTNSGVSGASSGGLPEWNTKRIYARTEDAGAPNERKVYLIYAFTSNPHYQVNPAILPSRYNNYGYETAKYIIYLYKNIPNKISLQTLSGFGPGGNRFVAAAYNYTPAGTSPNVNYPTTSYSPYTERRLYDFNTVSTTNNLRIDTVNTPIPVLSAGSPLVLRETTDPTNIDGSGIITRVLNQGSAGSSTPASFIVTMPRAASNSLYVAPSGYKTPYTTMYTGGFFTGAELPITSLSGLSGTTNIQVTTATHKKFYINQPIYLISTENTVNTQFGPFSVSNIVSDNSFIYSNTNAISAYPVNTNLLTPAARLYVRPTGVALHRNTDGGVQINTGDISPYSQIIRQTRKYFRYQSGKSILFSTGLLFKPSYDIQNLTVSTGLYTSGFPFYTINVTTEQDHGFAGQGTYSVGTQVRLTGLSVLLNPNPYNTTYNVQSVLSNKTFTINLPVSSLDSAPVDLSPGGIGKVEAVSWYDAVVRSGMFDEQNGIFFQYDGQKFTIGRRDSVANLTGTVSVTTSSSLVSGSNTKFLSQLGTGDYCAIKGMAYKVDRVFDDTSIQVSPDYRGISSTRVKINKTVDIMVSQDNFNLDKLDGTGPSGYVIDLNKMQMIYFDYSWYGAGRIRWGVRGTNGDIIYCHEMPNNNVNTEAYMRSGNLPARFEIITLPNRGIAVQANATEIQYSSPSSMMSSMTATLKRSTDLVNYYNLVPPVSAVIAPYTTQTFTVSSANINTFYDYKLFDSNNIDLAIDMFALSSANQFRINSLTNIPLSGKLNINNENLNYITLSSTTIPIENKLVQVTRNTNGLITMPKFYIDKRNVISTNQNCSPALSHWGTSVIMDGGFDTDKSYLFTAINNSNIVVPVNAEVPLISVRLAPAVDSGLTSNIGIRNLINRSYLTLKSVGIITNNTLNISIKLNPISTLFNAASSYINLGLGSIAQYVDHSLPAVGITPMPLGGDTILSFFANEQASGRSQVTTASIDSIRELSNSVLGGNLTYPDGPDLLTVFARANTNTSNVRCRVSWTEAQG